MPSMKVWALSWSGARARHTCPTPARPPAAQRLHLGIRFAGRSSGWMAVANTDHTRAESRAQGRAYPTAQGSVGPTKRHRRLAERRLVNEDGPDTRSLILNAVYGSPVSTLMFSQNHSMSPRSEAKSQKPENRN